MVSPVIYEASSELKKATQLDTSSPEPILPIGIFARSIDLDEEESELIVVLTDLSSLCPQPY